MSRLRPTLPWFRMAPIPGGTPVLVDCQVDSSALGDSSVSTQSLQDSSVDSTKLADGAVSTAGLQDSSVDSSKLADNAVGTDALQDSAVTAAELGDTSVTSAKINNDAVTFAKIQNITAQRLLGREDGVTGDAQEIALSAELRFDTNNDWLEISDSGILSGLLGDTAVITSKVSDCAITNPKLGDTAVVTAKINNQAVTYAKIQNVTAQRLLGRIDAASDGVVQEFGVGGGLTLDTNLDLLTSDSVIAASLAFSGRSELATSAEIDAGTDTGRTISPFYLGQSEFGYRLIQLVVTDTTLATGDSQFHFFIPPELDSWMLVDADAANATPSTTGTPTIQLRNVTTAADMLSTKITIDTAEKTSYTAATPPVIDTNNDSVQTGNEIAVDIDSAGTAEGLNILLSFRHKGT